MRIQFDLRGGVFARSRRENRRENRRLERLSALGTFFFAAFALILTAAPLPVWAEAGDELLSAGLEQHRSGDYRSAIATLEKFIAQYPNSPSRNKAELFDGHSHLSLGGFVDPIESATAREHFDFIIKQGKSAEFYREATFHNAHSYFDLRQYSEARTLFEDFLKDYSTDAYAQYVYYYLGVCAAQLGDYNASIGYFDKNLSEFPQSPLRWTCRLDKAATIGKSGAYQEAERQLTLLAAEKDLPIEIAGQIAIQRALLQIVQQKFDAAIQILDDFIARNSNNATLTETVQDAYLYEAYSYFAKKDFERALLIVETMERATSTLAPETAFLKIKLLLNLNRVDEAESLFNKLAASDYGKETPDAIAAYRALISLARGNWDAAIQTLVPLLKVVQTSSNAVAFGYFDGAADATRNLLAPHDFIEAVGTLVLSFASRFAAKKNASDNVAQEAVFQAASQYAQTLNDPALNLIVAKINQRRQDALTKPIDSSTAGGVSVATPAPGANAGAGGFLDPTNSTDYRNPGFSRPGDGRPNGSGANGAAQQSGSSYGPDGRPLVDASGNGAPDQNASAETESTPLTPDAARAVLEKATNFYITRDFNRANETLLEATTSSETFWKDCPAEAARIALLRANTLFALDKLSEAQMTCRDILDAAPNSQEAAVAAFYLGYGADALGRRDDALRYLQLAANSKIESPFTDVALYYLGLNEWERRDVEGAERTFSRLCRAYPKSAYWSHAVWALAKIEFDARNDVLAEELVNDALRKSPDASIVDYLLFLKGEIALRAKDYRKANVAFEMIVDQYPDGVWFSKAKNRLASIPRRFRSTSLEVADLDRIDATRSVPENAEIPIENGTQSTERNNAAGAERPRLPKAARPNPVDAASASQPSASQPNAPASGGVPPRRDELPSAPSTKTGSFSAAYPRENGSNYVRYDERTQRDADRRRVYELSFSGDSVRF